MILPEVLKVINSRENRNFILLERVKCSEYENINSKIKNYLLNFGKDPLIEFTTYCTEKGEYYDIILPNKDYFELNQDKKLSNIPVICVLSNKELWTLIYYDDNFSEVMAKEFKKFPYLYEFFCEISDYKIANPELSKKEVLQKIASKYNLEKDYKEYKLN